MALKTNGLPTYLIETNIAVNGQSSRLAGHTADIIEAQQAITEMDLANIETEQALTDMDLRLIELEVAHV